MSFKKIIEEKFGFESNYHKIANITINVLAKEVFVVLASFKDQSVKDDQQSVVNTIKYILRNKEAVLDDNDEIESPATYDFDELLAATDIRKAIYQKLADQSLWEDAQEV